MNGVIIVSSFEEHRKDRKIQKTSLNNKDILYWISKNILQKSSMNIKNSKTYFKHTLWEFEIRWSMELLASWRTLVEELLLYFFPFNLLTKRSFAEGLAIRGFCLARISLFQFWTYTIINGKHDMKKNHQSYI